MLADLVFGKWHLIGAAFEHYRVHSYLKNSECRYADCPYVSPAGFSGGADAPSAVID
ncbi:hypothetical protein VSK91_06730 [Bacillus swezeyi]